MLTRGAILAMAGACAASADTAEGALPVEYVTVAREQTTFDMALTGTLMAHDTVAAGFRNGGRITEMRVDAGDRVRAGDELARTDDTQQAQQVNVARAALDAARAAEEQARQAAQRAQGLLERGVGTRAASDAAQEALSTAEGGVAKARSDLDQAQRALDDTVLRAPADAVVTQRLADPGQVVGAAQQVLALAGLDRLEARFQIADGPMIDNSLGAPVTLSPIDAPERQMSGKVSELAPMLGADTGSVTVKVRIDETDPGRDAAAFLGAAVRGVGHFPAGEALSIPWTALTATGDRPAVWVVGQDQTVSLIPISIARFGRDSVVVDAGIEPGMVVVGEGSQLLYPGRKVRSGEVRR